MSGGSHDYAIEWHDSGDSGPEEEEFAILAVLQPVDLITAAVDAAHKAQADLAMALNLKRRP